MPGKIRMPRLTKPIPVRGLAAALLLTTLAIGAVAAEPTMQDSAGDLSERRSVSRVGASDALDGAPPSAH